MRCYGITRLCTMFVLKASEFMLCIKQSLHNLENSHTRRYQFLVSLTVGGVSTVKFSKMSTPPILKLSLLVSLASLCRWPWYTPASSDITHRFHFCLQPICRQLILQNQSNRRQLIFRLIFITLTVAWSTWSRLSWST